MGWFIGALILLGGAAAAFGVWPVVGFCLLVWFAVMTARVFNR